MSLAVNAAQYLASENGVKADGVSNNALILQGLIDRCASEGGGTVVIDKGVVVSGAITLKSYVTLEIAKDAVLQNTGDREDYPYVPVDFLSYYPERRAMIYAQNQKHVAVVGKGTIEGRSDKFKARSSESARVSLIRFDGCENVLIKDITLQNASMWTQHYYRCDKVNVSGITVKNYMKNDDGLNIDGCHDVKIDNCDIRSHDDAITLKTCSRRANKNILVTNCRLNSVKSAFKFGTESHAGFINVTARNLKITGGRDAIALFSVDGAKIENILIEEIEIKGTKCPLIVYLGERLREIKGDTQARIVGSVNNLTIRNIKASGAERPIILSGIEGHIIENINLEDLDLQFNKAAISKKSKRKKSKKSNDKALSAYELKIDTKGYPSSSLFGELNAWGTLIRYAKNVQLKNIHFSQDQGINKHVMFIEKAQNILVNKSNVESSEKTIPWVMAKDVESVKVELNWPKDAIWLKSQGDESKGLHLVTEF
ncbi:putative polygalacturonase [Lentisphaera araneosa HTCC2155]|uniref:Putative polygalacturonase n=1 Tax=Lentisphaera araneosa HTCC2155 TaxID=313628 RepID=A6DQX8_9BACT|nr:glycosyl hydrolase family 28 protein [Lentisphaera araneosa]EDM26028.1 putative polygalacturonase [Lentisphaera araneosa HTCC2155]